MTMTTDRETLTPARVTALHQVAADRVEYEGESATYWIDGVEARGWNFRTLADLERMDLVRRPQGRARDLVGLTPEGRDVVRDLPEPTPPKPAA